MVTVDRREPLPPRVLAFELCEQCDYDFRTDEGERGCNYGECPYLPEALDVWCPTCRYNFMVRDGNPECGDTPRCEFARTTARERVRTLSAWLTSRGR